MPEARYEVDYADLSGAWRIYDKRYSSWCRLGSPPEPTGDDLIAMVTRGTRAVMDERELCFDDKLSADAWLIHCYGEWGVIPAVGELHAGDRVLGFAAA